jgi:hypothetical protein
LASQVKGVSVGAKAGATRGSSENKKAGTGAGKASSGSGSSKGGGNKAGGSKSGATGKR